MAFHRRANFVSLGRVPTSNAFRFRLFNYALDDKAKKLTQLFADSVIKENVDMCNNRGQTALFVSCIAGHSKCVSALLKLGSNPNRRSDDGSTPVHAAAFSCNPSILQEIINFGGDLRLHDYQGFLPKDWALEAGKKQNKKVLQLIEKLQEDAVQTIFSFTSSLKSKPSAMSLTRSQDGNITRKKLAEPFKLLCQGFGDLVRIPIASSLLNADNQHSEVGFLTITPTIQSINLLTTPEPCLLYRSPPCFVYVNGFWGTQAVMLKKVQKKKPKTSQQYVHGNDLLIAELSIIRYLVHPYILSLMGVSVDDCDEKSENNYSQYDYPLVPRCLVYEQVSIGSLYYFLHSKQMSLPLIKAISILLQVLDALMYVHQRGFVHCCISSHAIQLINPFTAKLSDFYYAVSCKSVNDVQQSVFNPAFYRWLAPEILVGKKPSFESDVYSFCVVVAEIISGVLPWFGYDLESIRHQVVSNGHVPPVPEKVPKTLASVLMQGLTLSRQKRLLKLNQLLLVLQNFKIEHSLPNKNEFYLSSSKTINFSKTESEGIDVPDAVNIDSFYISPVKNFNNVVPNVVSNSTTDDNFGRIHADLLSTDSAMSNGHENITFCPVKNETADNLVVLDGNDVSCFAIENQCVEEPVVLTCVKPEFQKSSCCSDMLVTEASETHSSPSNVREASPIAINTHDDHDSQLLASMFSDSVVLETSFVSPDSHCDQSTSDVKENPKSTIEMCQQDTEAALVADGDTLPLHESVQRVHHSLVELSRVLKIQHQPTKNTISICDKECDHPLEGNLYLDEKATLAHEDHFEHAESPNPMSIDNYNYRLQTTDFVDEVLLALQAKVNFSSNESSSEVVDGCPSNGDVFTNVLEWKQAVKKATKSDSNSNSFKLGCIKRKNVHGKMSMEEERLNNFDRSIEFLEENYSNQDKSSFTYLESSDIDISEAYTETDNSCSYTLPKFNDPIFPSYVHLNESSLSSPAFREPIKNKVISNLQLISDDLDEKRKHSITSADLENIFSDFADRSFSSKKTSENQFACANDHVKETSKSFMVCQSSQTDFSCTGKQLVKSKAMSLVTPVVSMQSFYPTNPPMLDEFFQRTGDWNKVLHEPRKCTPLNPTTNLVNIIDNFSHPQRVNSDPSISWSNNLQVNFQPLESSGRLRIIQSPVPIPDSGQLVSPKKKTDSLLSHKKALLLTPSKLSFKKKLSLFESRAKKKTVSTVETKDTVAQPLQQTASLKVTTNLGETEPDMKKPAPKKAEDISKIGDSGFQTSTPRLDPELYPKRDYTPHFPRNEVCHQSVQRVKSSCMSDCSPHRGISGSTSKQRPLYKTFSLPNFSLNFTDGVCQSKSADCSSQSSYSSDISMDEQGAVENGISLLAGSVVDDVLNLLVSETKPIAHFENQNNCHDGVQSEEGLMTSLWTDGSSGVDSQHSDCNETDQKL